MNPVKDCNDRLITGVLDRAFKVHRNLGPGLLESVYQACLAHELVKAGIAFEREVALPVHYDGVDLHLGFRLDFLIGDNLIIETKTVDALAPVHLAQMLTYLKRSHIRRGLLLNFHVPVLKNGIKRVINSY